MLDLVVVMPVYNEEQIIRQVVTDWIRVLDGLGIAYELRAYNDGSRDGTADILNSLRAQFVPLRVFHQANAGHGPTLVRGYLSAVRDAAWVFQTDSDNELAADLFPSLWGRRGLYDLLIAERKERSFSPARRVVTGVSSLTVRFFFGRGVSDVNAPYRLMRGEVLARLLADLPKDMLVPNIIITGFFCRLRLRIGVFPSAYSRRQTGEVSIRHWKLLSFSVKSFLQTVRLSLLRISR